MIRRTTIEQHVGDYHDGSRVMRLHEVVTEDEDADLIDDIHDADVELASLDAGPRSRATAWLSEHSAEVDQSEDPAYWIRQAIAHATARREDVLE